MVKLTQGLMCEGLSRPFFNAIVWSMKNCDLQGII